MTFNKINRSERGMKYLLLFFFFSINTLKDKFIFNRCNDETLNLHYIILRVLAFNGEFEVDNHGAKKQA